MDTQDYGCDGLTVSAEGPVLTARLDRPNGNPMSMAVCAALTRLLDSPPGGAHVLVVSSAGPQFCMGRDRGATDPGGLMSEAEALIGLNQTLERTRLVTIARVQGHAAGFGAGLAALCDVAIAVRGAQFSFPESRINLAPAVVLGWLPRIVGRRAAFWLTATAEPVDGDELVRLGLVNEIVEDETALDAAVSRRVEALLAAKPRVHAEIRAMLRDFEGVPSDKAYGMAAARLVVGSQRRAE
jgi:enoyl-CoA hydratase/carnithine racemase